MASTIYGLTNYYNLFKSPVSAVQTNPVTNLLYGSYASNFYMNTVAKAAQSSVTSYLTSLNTDMGSLKTSAKSLSFTAPSSTMNKKAVTSSDASSVSGTANWNADSATYGIKVTQLAAGQTNKGFELKSDNASAFNPGLQSISIKSNGVVKKVSFTLSAGDTNKTALGKMAASINGANAGVKAAVVSDAKTGMSRIELNSENTGENSAFTLTDLSGNAVAASGANSVKDQARNAEYWLDGKQYSSQSNTVSINNGKVQITLNKADSKEIRLTVGADKKAIADDIKSFVENYNKMISLSGGYSDQISGAARLGGEFGEIINARKASLAGIGITVNGDNTLAVDENKLVKALETNMHHVGQIFGGSDGVAGKVYQKALEVVSSPLRYSQPNLFANGYASRVNSLLTGYQAASAGNDGMSGLYSGILLDRFL